MNPEQPVEPTVSGGEEKQGAKNPNPTLQGEGDPIKVLESALKDIEIRLKKSDRDIKGVDNLVKMGWLVILITLVGVVISLMALVVEFFSYRADNEQQRLRLTPQNHESVDEFILR